MTSNDKPEDATDSPEAPTASGPVGAQAEGAEEFEAIDEGDIRDIVRAGLTHLSKEDRVAVIGEAMGEQATVLAQSMTYSGPIPPSSELLAYEDVCKGAADRILAMAEKEQRNRHSSGAKYLHNDRLKVSGSIIVSIALIGAATYSATIGYPLLAALFGVSSFFPTLLKTVIGWLSKSDPAQGE
tara:strand:- start:1502 stop:2053 length:552 start_codon:yes stop_codon:yes gene_type:complete